MHDFAEKLKVPNFIGVFMRNTLPKTPSKNESAIVNLDVTTGRGTHWVCYYKRGDLVFYYDSFGFLPPTELFKYFKDCKIFYNPIEEQKYEEVNCGHRCLQFLYHNTCIKDG